MDFVVPGRWGVRKADDSLSSLYFLQGIYALFIHTLWLYTPDATHNYHFFIFLFMSSALFVSCSLSNRFHQSRPKKNKDPYKIKLKFY